MLKFLFGMAVGFVGGYFYASERAREEAARRLSTAPEPLRRAAEKVASATTGSVRGVTGAVEKAPAQAQVKQEASEATPTTQAGTERPSQAAPPEPPIARPGADEIAQRPPEQLPQSEPEGS